MTFAEVAAHVARVVDVAAPDLKPETRLVEELGLNSLALTELVVMLVDDPDRADDLLARADARDWADVTLKDLAAWSSGTR
jgi:hypothetical protein